MKLGVVVTFASLMAITYPTEAAKILATFQFPGRSHFVMFETLCKALADRGHEVTVLSHWPQKTPLPNYKDISLAGSLNTFFNNMTMDFVHTLEFFGLLSFIWNGNQEMCQTVLEQPQVQELIHSTERYDLIITEIFGCDCFLGLAHKWKVPFISMISSSALPWANTRVGNPDNPAYIPSYFALYSGHMTFTERVWNTLIGQTVNWGGYFVGDPPMQQLAMKHFGPDLPPLTDIAKNTSLILVNSHYSINQARPMVPAMVEVGGLHIPDPKPLPKELEKFLSEATKGVVYFSMGSLVRTDTFSADKLRSLIKAFSRLELRVLWKINPENLPPLADNVLAVKWLPQSDVLNHPNVRLFITHGGLMGTQEAVQAGVPLVGIPLFADQYFNVEKCVAEGFAVKVEYKDITTENVLEGINKVLSNASYAENAKRLSRLFRDRPMSARETAVFWTEYVIRHGGAHHLRTQAVNLPTYQYLLLDVIGALLLAVIFVIVVTWKLIKMIMSLLCKNKTSQSKKVKSS